MKTIYLFIITGLITTNLSAQITLTSASSSPQVGNTFNYVAAAPFTLNVNPAGANQTWDLSSVSGTSVAYNYIDLSSSSEPATFPSANLVETASGVENYYSSSTSGLTLEGHYMAGTARIIYSDKREFTKYPITYNDVYNETFSGTVENIAAAQTFDRSGTIEIMADGYGDLILPYTTVNNVLRVKAIFNYSDIYMGFPIYDYTDTIWTWYNDKTNNFIASASVGYANGFLLTSQATYIEQADLVDGIGDLPLTNNQISLYPNPADHFFFIKNTTGETLSLDIHDLRGALIKTASIQNGTRKVEISDLNPGIYLIKYVNGPSYYTEKLIVE